MEGMLRHCLREHLEATTGFFEENAGEIIKASQIIIHALQRGGKLLVCGNGGSAADAQHMAGELVNRFLKERRPLAAVALSTDTSVITSIGNDYGFEYIFEKQVRAIGRQGDVLMVISTSGNSPNCVRAVEASKEMGISTIGLLGRDGGVLRKMVDLPLIVRVTSTPRAQEVHILTIHVICQLIEEGIFGEKN
jgi:D-sedoheptulose 7-phosphate isomerase